MCTDLVISKITWRRQKKKKWQNAMKDKRKSPPQTGYRLGRYILISHSVNKCTLCIYLMPRTQYYPNGPQRIHSVSKSRACIKPGTLAAHREALNPNRGDLDKALWEEGCLHWAVNWVRQKKAQKEAKQPQSVLSRQLQPRTKIPAIALEPQVLFIFVSTVLNTMPHIQWVYSKYLSNK